MCIYIYVNMEQQQLKGSIAGDLSGSIAGSTEC